VGDGRVHLIEEMAFGEWDAKQLGDDERRQWMVESGQHVPRFVGVGGVEQPLGQVLDPRPEALNPFRGELPRRDRSQGGVLRRVVVVEAAEHVVEGRPGERRPPLRLDEASAGPEVGML
jgi:hypothetical protein